MLPLPSIQFFGFGQQHSVQEELGRELERNCSLGQRHLQRRLLGYYLQMRLLDPEGSQDLSLSLFGFGSSWFTKSKQIINRI